MKTKASKNRPTLEKALLIARAAIQRKPLDPLLLEVKEQCSFADYFLILSGTSTRQTQALAAHIEASMEQQGFRTLGVEGRELGHWILLDYGDVIVHIFFESVRPFYDLEGLWLDAPRLDPTAESLTLPD